MTGLIASAAMVQDIGDRVRQEDAALLYNSQGAGPTLVVLSDGMGGHLDGDLASRIIAREIFGELFLATARPEAFSRQSSQLFRAALGCANARLRRHIAAGHLSDSTGGTLVCVAIQEGQAHWVSVGDSLLYHFRKKSVSRLNEVHSMAAQLEVMVANNQIDQEIARNHPDRHCLTSAITGGDIQRIDCPEAGQDLEEGDILVAASDGIAVLQIEEMRAIVQKHRKRDSGAIATALLRAVRRTNVPGKDNTSIVVIKMLPHDQARDYAHRPVAQQFGAFLGLGRTFARASRSA